jgi:putative membrane protein
MVLHRAGSLLIGLGCGIAVALIGWTGVRAVGADVLRAGWAVPVCAALHVLQLLLSAIAWRRLSGCPRPALGAWLCIRWMREAVNTLLPVAQLGGPLVGVRLLTQRALPAPLAAAGTTLDITLESLTQFLFSLAGLLALAVVSPDVAWRSWVAGAIGLMALGSGGFVLAQRAGLMRLIEALTRYMGRVVPTLPPDALGGLHGELMRLQRDSAALASAAALHLLAWIVGVAETWIALLAMGYPAGALPALAIESLGMAARSAGFVVPGSLGVQEGGFMIAFGLLGLAPDAALALSMVKRARELLVGVPGLFAWQWSEGSRLYAAARPGKAFGSGSGVPTK